MSIFTDTYIKSLKPLSQRYEQYEGGGFGIRISSKGNKTWIYRYKINGITEKLTLGHYPQTSLANAKKRFIELSGLRKDGINPKEYIQKQLEKETNTVKTLIFEWYSNYVLKHLKKPLQIKQQIDADIIPLLGEIKLDGIQTKDITKALDAIVSRGAPVHANRVLSTIKQAFNYGASRGSLSYNVASNIRARDIGGLEHPKERYLSLIEIKKVWHFLSSEQNFMSIHLSNAIKIILLTGVRTAELRLAEWDEFNFEKSLWTIPAEHSKSGTVMKIHLSQQTKVLLLEMKENSHSIYVLPTSDEKDPITEQALPRAVNRIQKRVGIPKWTPHDCRRSFATHLGETLRIEPVVIEKCLSRKLPRIMATYNKNEMLPERKEALDRWANYIENLVTVSNVLPFSQVV
jgi:integrase